MKPYYFNCYSSFFLICLILLCSREGFAQGPASLQGPHFTMNPFYFSDSLGIANVDSMEVVDRFGEYTKLADVATVTPSGALRASHICNAGFFELHFFDGVGAPFFDDPTAILASQRRREAVCKVYEDLSKLIIPAIDPCPPNLPPTVRIWITSTNAASGPLASATPFHLFPNGNAQVVFPTFRSSGILDNEVWKTINGGVDSYQHLAAFGYPPGTYFHGKMTFHTDPSILPGTFPGADWWLIDCSIPRGPLQIPQNWGDFDLYEVALHEAIHLLGFYSLINGAGESKILWSFSNNSTGFFSRFDEYLYKPGTQDYLIENIDGCYNTRNVPPPGFDLYNFGVSCPDYIYFFGSSLLKIHSPVPYQTGTSLSHIAQNCYAGSPSEQFIMRPGIYYSGGGGYSFGIRYPHLDEVKILSDLDYEVRNEYGDNSFDHTYHSYNFGGQNTLGSRIAGVNDFYFDANTSPAQCSSTPMLVNCQGTLDISHILENDENAISFDCLESVFGTGTANPISGVGGNPITYTPNGGFSGMEILSYIPIDANGKRGNITYVFIRVECGLPDPCDNANCNLIPYGDFESLQEIHCYPLNIGSFTSIAPYNTPDLYENGGWLAPVAGTMAVPPSTAGFAGCTRTFPLASQGTKHIGFVGFSEGVTFELCHSLDPLKNYEISFDAQLHCVNGTSEIRIMDTDNPLCPNPSTICTPPFLGNCTNTCYNNLTVTVTHLGTIPISGGASWQPYDLTFSGSDAAYIVFHPNPSLSNYIYIDNVVLREVPSILVNLTATTINSPVCPGDVINVSSEVCLPLPLPFISPAGITLRSTLPTGFTTINGNGWVQNGPPNEAIYILYANNFDPITGCATVPHIQIQTPLTANVGTYTVSFNTDNWGCVAGGLNSATFDLYKPVTITKTVSQLNPTINSQVTYSIEVCNISTQTLGGLYVEDILAQGLIFVSSSDFSLVGTKLSSNQFSLAPATCTTLTFTVLVDGTECEFLTNCAELKAENPLDICPDFGCVDILPINAQMTVTGSAAALGPIPSNISTIYIDGTFTIDVARYSLRQLNITMGPNAKIVLPATGGSHILNIVNTNIKGCTALWDGIYVEGSNNYLYLSTNSVIEDAQQAVVSVNGGVFEISNSIFNANHRHVVVEPYQGTHSGTINNCKLICNRSLLPPLAGQETFIGVEIDDVNFIDIGSGNSFATMQYGVHIVRSSVNVRSNSFTDIYEPGGPTSLGSAAAVYARGGDGFILPLADCQSLNPTPATMPSLDISANTITDCRTGIDIKGHFHDLIKSNTITNIFATAIAISANYPPYGNDIDIEANYIEDVNFFGIAVFDMDFSTVKIKNDTIKDVNGVGIYLAAAAPAMLFGPQYRCFLFEPEVIRNNRIENSAYGIYATNLSNVHITENKVFPLPGSFYGIYTANNTLLQAHYNDIINISQAQSSQTGILSNINEGVMMSCNTVDKSGDAIAFDGVNLATSFIGNEMKDSNVGLHLMNGGPFVAVIGDQPPQNAGPLVNDNRWVGTFGSTNQTFVTNANGSLTTISVRAGIPFQPIVNGGFPFLVPNVILGNPPSNPCVNPSSLLRVASEIENTASQAATTTEVELAQRQLYNLMLSDSISWQGDSLLTAFKDSCDQANIGKFAQVGKYVMQGHLPLAWLINEGISSTSTFVDINEKLVNRVWLEMKLAQHNYPDQAQRTVLEEIAEICVTEGGPAVLRARHILNGYQLATVIDSSGWQFFVDTCGTGNRFAEIKVETNKLDAESWLLQAYPNPSGNSFQLRFEVDDANWTYELWSSTGQRVLCETLPSESTQQRISASGLADGLYIGLWKRNGKTVKSHRQLIMK